MLLQWVVSISDSSALTMLCKKENFCFQFLLNYEFHVMQCVVQEFSQFF